MISYSCAQDELNFESGLFKDEIRKPKGANATNFNHLIVKHIVRYGETQKSSTESSTAIVNSQPFFSFCQECCYWKNVMIIYVQIAHLP